MYPVYTYGGKMYCLYLYSYVCVRSVYSHRCSTHTLVVWRRWCGPSLWTLPQSFISMATSIGRTANNMTRYRSFHFVNKNNPEECTTTSCCNAWGCRILTGRKKAPMGCDHGDGVQMKTSIRWILWSGRSLCEGRGVHPEWPTRRDILYWNPQNGWRRREAKCHPFSTSRSSNILFS